MTFFEGGGRFVEYTIIVGGGIREDQGDLFSNQVRRGYALLSIRGVRNGVTFHHSLFDLSFMR